MMFLSPANGGANTMVSISSYQLALVCAAVAKVASNPLHKWIGDRGAEEIAGAIGAELSVYDIGRVDERTRFARFDFQNGSQLEVEVGPQPELKSGDNRPDGDHPTPGTPVAMAVAA